MVKSLEIIFNFEIKIWKPRALEIGTNVFCGEGSFCKIVYEIWQNNIRISDASCLIFRPPAVYRVTIFKCIFTGKYLARLHWEMHINVDLFIGGLNILQVLVLEMNDQFQENWGRGS